MDPFWINEVVRSFEGLAQVGVRHFEFMYKEARGVNVAKIIKVTKLLFSSVGFKRVTIRSYLKTFLWMSFSVCYIFSIKTKF